MSINKLKIMLNTSTRKYLRQGAESWKRDIIRNSGYTCFVTGRKQKNGNSVFLTAHHVDRTFNSICKEAHCNLNIKYHNSTTEYKPGELASLLAEIERLHRGLEGICISKEWHDRLHKEYGPHATLDNLREMKRNYRKMNHDNRCKVYKSKRSA